MNGTASTGKLSLLAVEKEERRSRRRDATAGLTGIFGTVIIIFAIRKIGAIPLPWSGAFYFLVGLILAYSVLYLISVGISRPAAIAFAGGNMVLWYSESHSRELSLSKWGPHLALEQLQGDSPRDGAPGVRLKLPVPLSHRIWITSAVSEALRAEAALVGLEEQNRPLRLLAAEGGATHGTRYTFARRRATHHATA